MNKDDILVLYSAGTGGEFLTGLISRTVDNINRLIPKEVGINHWNLACRRTYADVYNANPKKFPDGIDIGYCGETDKPINIYKDHLVDVDILADYWYNDMTVLALGVSGQYRHWAEVTWAKLNKVNITSNKDTFIKDHMGELEDTYNRLDQYRKYFTNFNIVDIGKMHTTPISQVLCPGPSAIIPQLVTLNRSQFDKEQKVWIEKNAELRHKI
tara:strand:+ start:1931 stop:2569 length:639 start_codon:yes stop_codon:yes gene_type:complete